MRKIYLYPYFLLFLLLFSCKDESNSNLNQQDQSLSDSSTLESAQTELNSNEDDLNGMITGKDETKLNPAQKNVQKLLTSCVKKDYSAAASLIMYRGSDQTRIGVDAFNYDNANEAKTVKVTCEVINEWLGESKSYEFISYEEEESEYGLQYVVEVLFAKQKIGIARHFFYFMDSPKGLILVNMI